MYNPQSILIDFLNGWFNKQAMIEFNLKHLGNIDKKNCSSLSPKIWNLSTEIQKKHAIQLCLFSSNQTIPYVTFIKELRTEFFNSKFIDTMNSVILWSVPLLQWHFHCPSHLVCLFYRRNGSGITHSCQSSSFYNIIVLYTGNYLL